MMMSLIFGVIIICFTFVLLLKKQNDKPTMDTAPGMAHTALRELVERAVEETRKLPNVGVCDSSRSQEDCDISESGYEDVLATAILNKVIEKFQVEQVDSNSNVLYEKCLKESHSQPNEIELGFDEGVEDGGSSLELQSQDEYNSDCGVPPPKYVRKHHHEPLSLTIEEQIEEVTTYTSDDEFPREKDNQLDCRNIRRVPFPELGMDIIDPSQGSSEESPDENEEDSFKISAHVDLITPVESWEENWLFQKKRAQAKAEPVAMLVPSPSSDFKALIGDKDAEDTSDLSECSIQSDEEIEEELMEAINNVIPRPITEITKHRENSKERTELKENEKHLVFDETDSCEGVVTKTFHDFPDDRNLSNTREEAFVKASAATVSVEFPTNSGTRENKQEKNEELSPALVPTENVRINERKNENISELVKSAEKNKSRHTDDIILLERDNEERIKENDNEQSENEKLGDPLTTGSKNILEEDVPIGADNAVSSECINPVINNETGCESPPVDAEVRKCREAVVAAAPEKRSINHQENDDTITLATPPRPGTIAEREHRKWENAPPIENNPYSEENIQKRLLQRQYSRKSADVPGINSELPANVDEETDIILGTKQIDFTRFGRDYYINDGRVKIEKRRSITSTTNRPESSLSQHSTGSDLEQVSYGLLERLEETSLRGSLCRRIYRGRNTSPHFVVNPLLHLIKSNDTKDFKCNGTDAQEEENQFILNHTDCRERNSDFAQVPDSEVVEMFEHFNLKKSLSLSGSFVINPLYLEDENQILYPDRDSGVCSIETNDENVKEKKSEEETWRLRCEEELHKQIYLRNGKKYVNFGRGKYHTFGGIKRRKMEYSESEESEGEVDDEEDINSQRNVLDAFPKKFQTFGGIKKTEKFNATRLKTKCPKDFTSDLEFTTLQTLRESNKKQFHKTMDDFGMRRNRWRSIQTFPKGPKSLQSSERKTVMNGAKKCTSEGTQENVYSFKDQKAKGRNETCRGLKSVNPNEGDSIRLQPPVMPEVIEKSFDSLIDLRKSKDKSRYKSINS